MDENFDVRIPGSEPGNSYLVIARNGSYVLGLRALVERTLVGCMILGIRMRAVVPGQSADPGTFKEAFPTLPFDRTNKERASVMGGHLINRKEYQIQDLKQAIQDKQLVQTLTKKVLKLVDPDLLVASEEEIAKEIRSGFTSEIHKLVGHLPHDPIDVMEFGLGDKQVEKRLHEFIEKVKLQEEAEKASKSMVH